MRSVPSFPAVSRLAAALLIAAIAGRVSAAHPRGPSPRQTVDFVRDIQPILETRCYECHGPKKTKNGLRLDLRVAALRGGDSGAVIVPGDSERSLLVRRIRGLDGEDRMPKDADPLTDTQIALIRTWIDQGAVWPAQAATEAAAEPPAKHWAYAAPVAAHVPEVRNAAWVRNDIDRFVLARLDTEGLTPSREAAFETLVRRASLDLIGLPPTLAELDAALADASAHGRDAAYARVVDRLLASPHYGERWARPWLDLARYADSHGYEKDRLRVMWKYRDWVIDALNADMPFTQFSIEQIAGDMLPDATDAQRIASGFHRNTMLNQEGGIDVEEQRWETLVDRVNTTATVWLGSTLGCAQCHDHKYDPFTQRDYYRMLAFFENVEYTIAGQAGGDRWIDEPQIALPTPEQDARRRGLQEELDRLTASLRAESPARAAAQARWEQSVIAAERVWTPLTIDRFDSSGGSSHEPLDDRSLLVGGDNPASNVYTIAGRAPMAGITAVRIEALPDPRLPGGGPGRDRYGNFVLNGFSVAIGESEAVPLASVKVDDGSASIENFRWGIDATRDPAARLRRQAVFVAARPFAAAGAPLRMSITTAAPVGQALGRFRVSVTASPSPLRVVGVSARLRAALVTPRAKRTPQQAKDLAAQFRAVSPMFRATRDRIDALQKSLRDVGIVTAMVMKDRTAYDRPSTWVRRRGNFLDRTEQVYAAVPSFLPALPDSVMPNRLGLARWLVDERNPLTPRVAVNRAWEQFFGRGLVDTSEDFGSQGAAPSHPELLDWLAVTFVEQGWRLKRLHREIAMSATYRQSSTATPALAERDPYNRLLARGPRFRVEAEMVRDIALTASGLLARKVGGPSVFPPQPDGIWQNPYSSERWIPSAGEDRYRRGLYTFIRRTAPYPAFTTFDTTSREACTVRRVRTNTPLQALATLNDDAFFEAARALARRMIAEPSVTAGEDAVRARAAYGFRIVTSRLPTPQEIDRVVTAYRRHLDQFRAQPERAARAIGGYAVSGVDAAEQAAWTLVANALLNLDETITKE